MSNLVFPSLAGLLPSVKVAPRFSTRVQSSVSGRETRAKFMLYPLWDITIGFEFLRTGQAGSELDTLAGFFMQVAGSWDSFLFQVPNDSSVTDMNFGTGDGTTTVFQLIRRRGAGGFSFAEPVQNPTAVTAVKINGVTKTPGTNYTVGGTGLITFTAAPAVADVLTWTGTFYYRCRLLDDTADFTRFMQDLWELRQLRMVGAPGIRV